MTGGRLYDISEPVFSYLKNGHNNASMQVDSYAV